MSNRLFRLTLIAVVAAPVAALCAPSDRHPGVYQFQALPEGYCAFTDRQNGLPQQQLPRLSRLGDLPAAYVIRVSAAATPAPTFEVTRAPGTGTAPFDPCARVSPALVRVR